MKLQVTIDHLAHAKIMHWIRMANGNEVSGFGKVVRAPNRMHVTSVTLLEQVNSPSATIIDATDIGRALYQTREELGDLNFWWHSHHYMSAFFSDTDYKTMRKFGQNGWLLATVFNNRGETMTGVYTKEPIEFLSEGFDLKVLPPPLPEAMTRQLDDLYRRKVTIAPRRYRGRWHRNWNEREEDEAIIVGGSEDSGGDYGRD